MLWQAVRHHRDRQTKHTTYAQSRQKPIQGKVRPTGRESGQAGAERIKQHGESEGLGPPDAIPDLEVLHGLPGTLTLTLTANDQEVDQVIPVEMWAMPDETWDFCNYGYYGTGYGSGYGYTGGYATGTTGYAIEPQGIASLPIPLD